MSAPSRVLIDGMPTTVVSVFDRGLSYGDGLFETIRFVQGKAPLWARHMQRLQESGHRLRLPIPDASLLLQEARFVIEGLAQAVVRITVTRGIGERGYAPPVSPQPMRVVAGFEAPPMHGESYVGGVRVRWCETRMAMQPLLAGMKHLNRLEQVLARAEWSDAAITEGLLRDTEGGLVSGTMTNVFAVTNGVIQTPSLDACGVAGVARAEVLAVHPGTQVGPLGCEELQHASEVFLSSSVRGILPVQAVGDTVYVPGPVTRALQQHWRGLGFPMEQA
ncbi:aminodeoxychorismate lyase [Dyella sp. 20L07]|uniref:aminodeoxychorismate lyase n=1 Tax=Dyella sp. 20L07 TaxID=3384240 RepID=UPI003D2B998A